MEKILIYIKHHLRFLWDIIERINGYIFYVLFKSRMEAVLPSVFNEAERSSFTFRRINLPDAEALHLLLKSQDVADLEYFSPHKFDLESIRKQCRNKSFLMMGAFDDMKIIGYFFLRFFINKKCFVGRLIDKHYRGKGIGLVMNYIMYETSWRMGFRCLSTISRNNKYVMKAHAKNQSIRILKELNNDYLLVEFVRDTKESV